jgi:hypothetical protein
VRAIREIGAQDTLQNKIFRVVMPTLLLDPLKKRLNAELVDSFCQKQHHSKYVGEILDSFHYEEFPSLFTTIAYVLTRPV